MNYKMTNIAPNNNRHLFHICGKKGSGKSTLLSFLKDDGFYTTEVRFHLELAMKNGTFDAKKIPIPFYWTADMMDLCYQRIQSNDVVFLTGLYHQKELDFFSKGHNVHKIGIMSGDHIRHERILHKSIIENKPLNIKEILQKDRKRDGTEPGFVNADINSLIERSEILLYNNGSIEDFKKEHNKLILYLKQMYL